MSKKINFLEGVNRAKGEIQVIYGPMFSGKTTELLRRIRRFKVRNDVCLLLKTKDNWDCEVVATHDSFNRLEAISCENLFEKREEAERSEVLGIDEGQFFEDLIPFCELMASLGKIVIVACLDSDYRREPFGSICELIAKSEKVTKLSSICHYCKENAAFTARISLETAVRVLGSSEKYRPVCRICYFSLETRK